MAITIGCDPELFLTLNGKPKSAIGVVPGDKQEPHPVNRGAVQCDNVLLEFNIDPASNMEMWQENIKAVLEASEEIVKPYGIELYYDASSISMPKKELKHYLAHVFGCEPDFNVWIGENNPRPSSDDPNLRSAGGHIHVGYDNPSFEESIRIAQAFSYIGGLQGVLLDDTTGSVKRKSLYGKTGNIRFKSYGVELRELSSFWVKTPELRAWAYNVARRAVEASVWVDWYMECLNPDELRRIVDNGLKEEAQYWLKELNLDDEVKYA